MARSLSTEEHACVQHAIDGYIATLGAAGISLRVRRNFEAYIATRHDHGDIHLNQAFDPKCVRFGPYDFWLLAESLTGEPLATYCSRRFLVDKFFDLIRSQALWFGNGPRLVDPRFVVECEIPPFGGEVAHGGGLWVREDHRGSSHLAAILPRFARAIALRNRPLDYDSGMIRNDPRDPPKLADRKANIHGDSVVWLWSRVPVRRRLVSARGSRRDHANGRPATWRAPPVATDASILTLKDPLVLRRLDFCATTVGTERQKEEVNHRSGNLTPICLFRRVKNRVFCP